MRPAGRWAVPWVGPWLRPRRTDVLSPRPRGIHAVPRPVQRSSLGTSLPAPGLPPVRPTGGLLCGDPSGCQPWGPPPPAQGQVGGMPGRTRGGFREDAGEAVGAGRHQEAFGLRARCFACLSGLPGKGDLLGAASSGSCPHRVLLGRRSKWGSVAPKLRGRGPSKPRPSCPGDGASGSGQLHQAQAGR